MKRYGYYIRLGGDAEIAESIARGDVGMLQPMRQASSEAVRRVDMWQHTPAEWRQMRLDARRKYRHNRRAQGLGKVLLVGYALLCYCAQVGFDALWEAIEGRTQR